MVCRQKRPPGGPAFDESLLFYHASLIKQIAGPTSDNHMHRIAFRQILRDAEIAYAISPSYADTVSPRKRPKNLVELRIPRAANVARITHFWSCSKSLNWPINCSQKASSELATQN